MNSGLFTNPNCAVCANPRSIPVAPEGQWNMRRVARSFEFSHTLSPYWHLELFCHGRRELTEIMRLDVHLNGRSYDPDRANRPLDIYSINGFPSWGEALPKQISCLLGVTESPISPEQLNEALIKPIILPDHFLVFGDAHERPTVLITMPVVHLVTSFCRQE